MKHGYYEVNAMVCPQCNELLRREGYRLFHPQNGCTDAGKTFLLPMVFIEELEEQPK